MGSYEDSQRRIPSEVEEAAMYGLDLNNPADAAKWRETQPASTETTSDYSQDAFEIGAPAEDNENS